MKLIFVRHGESLANKIGLNQGWFNTGLTQTGVLQAQEIAAKLTNESISAIYVSDLLRTVQTARIINSSFNLPLVQTSSLREPNRGRFEGRKARTMVNYVTFIGARFVTYRESGIESVKQVKKRSRRFIDFLKRNHSSGETILIVSHGNFITNTLMLLLGKPNYLYDLIHPKNCELKEVVL